MTYSYLVFQEQVLPGLWRFGQWVVILRCDALRRSPQPFDHPGLWRLMPYWWSLTIAQILVSSSSAHGGRTGGGRCGTLPSWRPALLAPWHDMWLSAGGGRPAGTPPRRPGVIDEPLPKLQEFVDRASAPRRRCRSAD